jgi:DNA-binding NtrC family response regulator
MERLAGEVANIKPKKLAPETLEYLNAYDWPGNVRELKYVIERTTYKVDGDTISPHHLPQEILAAYSHSGDGETLSNRMAQVEKQILMDVYEQCQGDLEDMSHQLSIPLESLKQLIQKHRIDDAQ